MTRRHPSHQPAWRDSQQGDLLELVAQGTPASDTADDEWDWFLYALEQAADDTGLVDPNELRRHTRGHIAPKRAGAFTSRAVAQGLIEPAGWVISDDHEGRNAGRPCRAYQLTPGPGAAA